MLVWSALCRAICCHSSGYLWPRLRAHCFCQVERRDGESCRPLTVLDIGSEKRRNLGQLCHPFEVGTACLWSGGRAPGFHVLLSCDLGRPQLHKPYWIYRLGEKKKKKTLTQSIPALTGLGSLELYKVGWMRARQEFQGQPLTQVTNKHSNVLKYWLITWEINRGFKGMMWQLISGCITTPKLWHLFAILLTIVSHPISISSVILWTIVWLNMN